MPIGVRHTQISARRRRGHGSGGGRSGPRQRWHTATAELLRTDRNHHLCVVVRGRPTRQTVTARSQSDVRSPIRASTSSIAIFNRSPSALRVRSASAATRWGAAICTTRISPPHDSFRTRSMAAALRTCTEQAISAAFEPTATSSFWAEATIRSRFGGFRVEPGDIQSTLDASPLVRESVVVAREHASKGTHLIAYIVPATTGSDTIAELRSYAREMLPEVHGSIRLGSAGSSAAHDKRQTGPHRSPRA